MTGFGDVVRAVREVLLMQSRIDQLDGRLNRMSDDLEGLAELVGTLRDRVSRLEGIITGVEMARGAGPPRLPGK